MYVPKTIKQAIKPLLWVNYLFGMGVVDFERRYSNNWFGYLYTAAFLIAYVVGCRFSLYYYNKYFIFGTFSLSRIMFKSTFNLNAFLTASLIIVSRIKAPRLQTAITMIERSSQRMERMGMPMRYRYLFLYQIKLFSLCGFSTLVLAAVVFAWHFEESTPTMLKLSLTVVCIIPFTIIFSCNASICFWIYFLEVKFRQLNQQLRRMLTTTPDSPQHKRVLAMKYDFENKNFASFRNENIRGGSHGNANTMKTIKQLHLELVKIARTLNTCYGVQVLLMMVISFIFTIGLLYVLYRVMWMNLSGFKFIREVITMVLSLLAYSSQIFMINHMCAETCIEAGNTGDIICELYEPSTSKEFRAEIREFCLQMIQNPLVFNACGFFDLDHEFIQGVAGSITTYLVILIQVGDLTIAKFSDTTTEPPANFSLS